MVNCFRLIDTGPRPGPENMAIDAALLDCFRPEEDRPVLRLYGWEPPAFSCGRFQQPEQILDLDRCRRDGIPVVRRITGGGVLFHAAELTYSLVCPVAFAGSSRGVKEAFFHLTSFLLRFYRDLGLAPAHPPHHFGGATRLGGRTPLCFAGIETCDIIVAGRKLGGNAQRRLKNAVFQHGSIPLRQMAGIGAQYLLTANSDLTAGTTALADQGITLDRNDLAGRLAAVFAGTFAVERQPDRLSADELARIATYMQNSA